MDRRSEGKIRGGDRQLEPEGDRRVRHMSANPSASWTPELSQAFRQKIKDFWDDEANKNAYENPDNFREARVGNISEELSYMKTESDGCCGSFEIEWYLEGVKVRYGFNYGH